MVGISRPDEDLEKILKRMGNLDNVTWTFVIYSENLCITQSLSRLT